MRHFPLRLLFLLSAAAGISSRAAVKTTSASGDWATNGNWVGGSFANVGGSTGGAGADSAIINGHAMTISGTYPGGDFDPRTQSVTINAGGSVTENRTAWMRVGDLQSGTVNINQGTFNINTAGEFRAGAGGGSGFLNVGDGSGTADAVLNLSNKQSIFGGNMDRGSGGNATVVVASDGLVLSTGGTHIWGDQNLTTGTLSMSGGTFSKTSGSSNFGVNSGATGVLNMSGGTFSQASGDVVFGNNNGGTGRLIMSGNAVLNHASNDFRFGLGGAAAGTLTGNAQIIHPPSNWFQMGQNSTGAGTFTLSNNAKITTGGDSVRIGYAGTGVVTLNDNAQFVSTNGSTSYPDGNTTLGRNAGSSGTVNINGNALFSSIQTIAVGEAGNGRVNQTGGTLTSNDALTIGRGQGGAGQGTYVLSAGTVNVGTVLTLGEGVGGTAARGTFQQTGGLVRVGTQLRLSYGGSALGTYNLEGGTLRVDNADLTMSGGTSGTFNWGAGVIAGHTPGVLNSAGGVTDFTTAPAPTGPVVRAGDTLAWDGNLTTGYSGQSSTLDLGSLYLSGGTRQDVMNVTGTLNLSAAGDTLSMGGTPYLLRPFGFFTEDYGTIPLVTAGTLTGTFDTFIAPLSDSRPWSLNGAPIIGGPAINPATLGVNTYQLQYTGTQVLFHYRVAGTVPEPGSFALMGLGAWVLRLARRRK